MNISECGMWLGALMFLIVHFFRSFHLPEKEKLTPKQQRVVLGTAVANGILCVGAGFRAFQTDHFWLQVITFFGCFVFLALGLFHLLMYDFDPTYDEPDHGYY